MNGGQSGLVSECSRHGWLVHGAPGLTRAAEFVIAYLPYSLEATKGSSRPLSYPPTHTVLQKQRDYLRRKTSSYRKARAILRVS